MRSFKSESTIPKLDFGAFHCRHLFSVQTVQFNYFVDTDEFCIFNKFAGWNWTSLTDSDSYAVINRGVGGGVGAGS